MALRRSFTAKTAPPPRAKEIPTELAMKILEAENEVLKFPTPSTIQDLVSHYSEAIEFYSSINDLKYLDFQKRMHNLLTNPKVFKSFSKTPVKPAIKRSESFSEPFSSKTEKKAENKLGSPECLKTEKFVEEKINSGDVSPVSTCPSISSPVHKDKGYRNSLQLDGGMVQGKNFRIIVDRHSKYSKDSANKAINDFKSQDMALAGRLASRKKQMITRSMTSSSFSCLNLSDILEEPVNTENSKKGCFVIEEHPVEMDKFEMKLEEIMEKNFAQRASKIAEIRLKYESQISELSSMGELMQKVVAQMKSSMQEEISAAIEEFDKLRKEEIRMLKEKKTV